MSVMVILQPERVISSPESSGYYGITSDVWSFGITMVTMLTSVKV